MAQQRAKPTPKVTALARDLGFELLGRELSARTILFHQAIAERLGIGATDHKCLDLALRSSEQGPVTAGRLAEMTGLTTGAITGVLDRLEKAGFVRREKDPSDRRQVVVRVLPDREREVAALFAPFAKAWAELCARYDEKDLELIRDFMTASSEMLQRETERLRGEAPHGKPAADASVHEVSAPSAGHTEARLEAPRGASDLTIAAGKKGLLYRLRATGKAPQITAHGARLLLEYKGGLLDFRRAPATLELGPDVAWRIAVHRGASKLSADLRALDLLGFELHGGASDVTIALPAPDRELRVRVHGGASALRITRPAGVPLRVLVAGGASKLVVDTLELGAVGDELRWEAPGWAKSARRLDVEVHGGADRLSITEK